MRRIAITITLVVALVGLANIQAKASTLDSIVAEGKKRLASASADEGFRYFSGQNNGMQNHPSMFAYRSMDTGRQMVVVTASGFYKEFDLKDFDLALEMYKTALRTNGYIVKK